MYVRVYNVYISVYNYVTLKFQAVSDKTAKTILLDTFYSAPCSVDCLSVSWCAIIATAILKIKTPFPKDKHHGGDRST